MKAQSAHSESHARSVATEKAIATRSSQANSALAESPSISTIVEEQRTQDTSVTSYTTSRRGSQAGPSTSVTGCLAPYQAYQGSLSLIVDRFEEQICWRIVTRINISRNLSLKMPKTGCTGTCCLIVYALGVTVGFILSVVICIATSKDCQLIRNGENLTDYQQSQAKQTFFEANIFSQVQDTGVEMTKKEEQGRCPTQYRLPPILLGLHFLKILALALLTFHTVFHGYAILKKAFLKRKQEQAEAALAKAEAERLKMKAEVDKQVAARLKKEKVEDRFNPDISLSSA